jgi:uncharacterized RDD family membrane protein YckC
MAFCANCGRSISESAVACPNCGHLNEVHATTTGVPLAGFWSRVAATLLDGIILSVAGLLLGRFIYVGGFLYSWLMLGLNDGRTLGKMALGIRIALPNGGRISLGTAAARQGVAIVSGLALGLGYLWAIWDPERRTWHDQVAGTRAFRVER